jgi:hypothetical protein
MKIYNLDGNMKSILDNIASFLGTPTSASSESTPKTLFLNVDQSTCEPILFDQENCCGCLIFSKHRPFQLHQLLLSIEGFVSFENSTHRVVLIVIYVAGIWGKEYQDVFAFHPQVIPIQENETTSHNSPTFQDCLLHCFDQLFVKIGVGGCILFCVDDQVFVAPVELR